MHGSAHASCTQACSTHHDLILKQKKATGGQEDHTAKKRKETQQTEKSTQRGKRETAEEKKIEEQERENMPEEGKHVFYCKFDTKPSCTPMRHADLGCV